MFSRFTRSTKYPPHPLAPVVDWSKTDVEADYKGHYVKVIDDVFTPEECAELIALAESDSEWKQAAVHYGQGQDQNYVDTNYRNSERILRFDKEAADKLYQKLLPYVSDIVELKPGDQWHSVVDTGNVTPGVWKMDCLNERLSFLKYTHGQFFRAHCDGQLQLPDGRMARVTVQIYLGDDGVKGGTTRILGRKKDRYFDVEPKKGRVLLFQQRGVWHTGEDVSEGTKYTLRSDLMYRYYEDGEEVPL